MKGVLVVTALVLTASAALSSAASLSGHRHRQHRRVRQQRSAVGTDKCNALNSKCGECVVSSLESEGCVYDLALKQCVKKETGKKSSTGFATKNKHCFLDAVYEVSIEMQELIVTDTTFSENTALHCKTHKYPYDLTLTEIPTKQVFLFHSKQENKDIFNEVPDVDNKKVVKYDARSLTLMQAGAKVKSKLPDLTSKPTTAGKFNTFMGSRAAGLIREVEQTDGQFYKGVVCDTLAIIAIKKLQKKLGTGVRMEWLALRYRQSSGHSVVVLNRDTNSQVDDPSSWGNAVLVDLWFRNMLRQLDVAPYGIYYGSSLLHEMRSEFGRCFAKGRKVTNDHVHNKEVFDDTEDTEDLFGGFGVQINWDTTWALNDNTPVPIFVDNAHNTEKAWNAEKKNW